MKEILDVCIFIKCPLKDSCLRFGKKLRENQVTIFRYNKGFRLNNGCKNYWNTPIKKQVV